MQALLGDPTSQVARAAGSDGYSLTEHLLFLIVDELRLANWLSSEDGSKNRNRPDRLSPLAERKPRLGVVPDGVTQDQVLALLASLGPQEE